MKPITRIFLPVLLFLSVFSGKAQIVGGFYPNWYAASSMDNLQWTKMTDLFYAFAAPTNTGGYTLTNETRLTTLVTNGNANNVRIHLSFGGAAQGSTGWSTMISTLANRNAFATTCKNLVLTHSLNGINLDWEFPTGAQAANYADLALKIRVALDEAEVTLGRKVYLTAAVAPLIWNEDGINATFLSVMDYVMPMAFDDCCCSWCGGTSNHSSYGMAVNAFLHWTTGIPGAAKPGKGVAPAKIVIAIPFYDNGGLAFNSFSSADPAGYFGDADGFFGGKYYNSCPLIQQKGDYVMQNGGAGLWTWELVQDRTDQYSLLNCMKTIVDSYACPFSDPGLGADQSICGLSSITLNSGVSTASGRTFTWKRNGVVVVNASTSATTYDINTSGTYRVEVSEGACMKFDEVVISGTLTAFDLGGPYNLCNPVSVTLNTGYAAAGKTFVWQKNSVTIPGATSPSYTATTAGTYSATVSASGCTSVSDNVTVTSSLPVANHDTICSPGTINVATSLASDWYTAETGGSAFLTNSSAHSASISSSTTYWVQPTGGASTSNTTMRSAFQGDGWQQDPNVYGTKFQALTSLTLDQVSVNAGGGNLIINVVASNGTTVVASKTFTALSAGISTLNLGFNLTAGTYYLNAVGSVSTLYVDLTPAANYTVPGIITVEGEAYWDWSAPYGDGYVLSGDYGTFYNLKVITGNTCARVPVYAILDPAYPPCASTPPVADFSANVTTACIAQTITFTDASIGATSWSWNFGTGASPETATGVGPHSVSYSSTGTKTVALTATNAFGPNTNTKTNYITVTTIPGSAGTITGSATVCSGSSQAYSITAVSGATNYTWIVPAGASIASGQGTVSVSVNFTGASSGNITVTPSNTCGNGGAASKAIVVDHLPSAAGTVSGPSPVCTGSAGNVYTISSVTNATGYTWTVPSGATVTLGQGTTSATVTFGSTSGDVTVVPTNSCGSGTSASKAIVVNTPPSAAGAITGGSSVCPNQSAVAYSISAVPGATNYTWTVPSGATIPSGQGTTAISVNFASASGNVSVVPSNSCGSGAAANLAVSVGSSPLPLTEGFETTVPPASWSLVNPDAGVTWASYATGANSSAKSAYMNYWTYTGSGNIDELKTFALDFSGQSTITMSFWHAYSWRDAPATANDRGDSLEVKISVDCGTTWTSLWKKGRVTLSTLASGAGLGSSFVPTAAQWVENTINLSSYAGQSVIIKFVGLGYNGNNLYLDNINITGTVTSAPIADFTATPLSACIGQNIVFTNASTNAPTSWSWDFGVNATPATATGQGPHSVSYSASGNKTVSLTVTNGVGSDTKTQTNYITVNPTAAASVSIGASATTICAGTSVTFTATPTNGGASPAYQWKVNGGNVGTSSNTYTSSALANNDAVTVEMTSNAVCPSPATATSNTVTMTVNPAVAASVSIGASATTICAGTSVTFTATPTNGGASPAYQWKVNGGNVGTNSNTYTSSALANNDAVTVEMTSNAVCPSPATATSNTVTMTVNPAVAASVSIGASATTICSGTSVTFTATPVNGGASPVYQWKVNGGNVGTNSTTYVSATLADNDAVTVVMTSNAVCVTGSPATSNTITMTVNPPALVGVSISASATTICSGTSVTFTATPFNGGASPAYQWKVNGSNVGTNSTTYTSSALANNNTVTVVMTSSATCPSAATTTSNTVTMTVNPSVTAGVSIAATASSICTGTPVTFTATPVNGGASPVYQWKVNGGNVGTNSTTYVSSTLANNDAVTVVMTSNASCVTGSPATSNTITMSVTSSGVASVSIGANTNPVCSGQSVTFTASPVNGGTPSYQWKVNGSDVGTNSNTYASSTLANNDAVTVVMTSSLGCATGSPTTSNTVTMTVNPSPAAIVNISATATNICTGTSATFTAVPANGGGSPNYQWKVNGGNVGTNSDTYSSSTLANNDAITVVMTSSAACVTGSPATSNTITMTVNSNAASVNIVPSANPVCSSSEVTFTATPTNGGVSPVYQWKVNGSDVGTNSAAYTSTTLANNNNVTVVMTSNASCVTGSPATSNAIIMSIIPIGTSPCIVPVTSAISGPVNVPDNQTGVTYSVTDNPGSAYSWTVPAGAAIISGQGTNTITVSFGTSGGTVEVTETNTYGPGTPVSQTVNVGPLPVTSPINGPSAVSLNETGVTFSVPENPGSTYNWSVPPGATIISGQGTNTVTVDFGTSGGTIGVTETNAFGAGTPVSINIVMNPNAVNSGHTIGFVELYPHPFADHATLNIRSSATGKLSLKITDIHGKILYIIEGKNTNEDILLGDGLDQGVFIIHAIQGEKVQFIKLVKTE